MGDTLWFKYSGFGQRIQKIEKKGSTYDTTNYIYDGIYAIAELDGSDNVKAKYIYANGLLLSKIDLAMGRYYTHHDGLGSIVGMTDVLKNVAQTYLYDGFGTLVDSG
jgi:hypothetical protein